MDKPNPPQRSWLDHEKWMGLALEQARKAGDLDEVPVGAVLVTPSIEGGELLGEGYNCPISQHDPTAHAEMMALRAAAKQVENYRLPNTTLYVTLEPCTMCVGALIHARIGQVIFAAKEPKAGMLGSAFNLLDLTFYNHRFDVSSGVLEEQASTMLSSFFANKRAQKKRLKENLLRMDQERDG